MFNKKLKGTQYSFRVECVAIGKFMLHRWISFLKSITVKGELNNTHFCTVSHFYIMNALIIFCFVTPNGWIDAFNDTNNNVHNLVGLQSIPLLKFKFYPETPFIFTWKIVTLSWTVLLIRNNR